MWHKIKDNLLTIATSLYFLFWGYLVINLYIFFKKYEETTSLLQENLSGNWNGIIFKSVIFTILSFLLIFALIRKHKKKILKTLSYIFVPLIFVVNILFTIILINGYCYTYIAFGTNEQIKQFFAKYNPDCPIFIYGHNFLQASVFFKRDPEIVKFFIDKGADVNNVYRRTTPLYYAVIKNSPEIVELLIKNGADVNFQDKYQNKFTILMKTVVSEVSPENKEKMVELLLNAGANVDSRSSSEGTAFDYACLMINKKEEDFFKNRAVTLRTIELLLKAGANPLSRTTPDALSQYEVAQNFNNKELIELFEKYRPVE